VVPTKAIDTARTSLRVVADLPARRLIAVAPEQPGQPAPRQLDTGIAGKRQQRPPPFGSAAAGTRRRPPFDTHDRTPGSRRRHEYSYPEQICSGCNNPMQFCQRYQIATLPAPAMSTFATNRPPVQRQSSFAKVRRQRGDRAQLEHAPRVETICARSAGVDAQNQMPVWWRCDTPPPALQASNASCRQDKIACIRVTSTSLVRPRSNNCDIVARSCADHVLTPPDASHSKDWDDMHGNIVMSRGCHSFYQTPCRIRLKTCVNQTLMGVDTTRVRINCF